MTKANGVDHIYIALPMASQPRILQILDELKDTTASIFFVPDLFVTDLIQGRVDHVAGMPVVAVCETPFTGHAGDHVRMPPRNVVPKPVQRPHPPVWVACTRRETMDGMGMMVFPTSRISGVGTPAARVTPIAHCSLM